MFAGLAVLLPAGIAAAVLARSPSPRVDALPVDLARAAGWDGVDAGRVLWRREDLWGELALTTTLARDPGGALTVGLTPAADLARPDVLVYWAAGTEPAGRLPEDAVLLGALAGAHERAFALPGSAGTRAGRLLLYSLAHAELVAEAPLPEAR
jgi:hypothetical protein